MGIVCLPLRSRSGADCAMVLPVGNTVACVGTICNIRMEYDDM